ncbi:hypothetical protein BMS3Abin03_02842 [bacterium BMS3Abin03]|nr:hypothetical protein BMS3Abin03_02842 [bacterium BMS3Abin03]
MVKLLICKNVLIIKPKTRLEKVFSDEETLKLTKYFAVILAIRLAK